MNYSEYFGNHPSAGFGTKGKKDEWSDYFKNQSRRVPVEKVYSDSPIVVDRNIGKVKTYLDVDPVVTQRPTHEQMLMQQQQMAISRRLAQEQKDYYGKVWENKINQMEVEEPQVPRKVRKLSFVDKPSATVDTSEPVSVGQNVAEEPHREYGDSTPLSEAEIEDAMKKLREAAEAKSKSVDDADAEGIPTEELMKDVLTEGISTEELMKDVLTEEPVEDIPTEEQAGDVPAHPESVNEETAPVEELTEDVQTESVNEETASAEIELEPVIPEYEQFVPVDEAEVEDVTPEPEDESEAVTSEPEDDILGGLGANDIEEEEVPEDLPEDLPEDIENLNIDTEYEEERKARKENADADSKKKKTTKKKTATASKRKKPVVTVKKKK